MAARIDTAAGFEAAFRTHYEALARFAFRFIDDRAAAEDVVQEVFAGLWTERHSVRPADVRAWLYAAVRNRALNVLRRDQRSTPLDPDDDSGGALESADPGPERLYDDAELRTRLAEAFATLPERQASAMLLRWRDELSYEEIARILGISVAGVEKHLTRGLAALRGRLTR